MGHTHRRKPDIDLGSMTGVVAEDPDDRRNRTIAIAAAVVIHIAILSLNLPISADQPPAADPLPENRRLELIPFVLPPPPPEVAQVQEPTVGEPIPIPGPTPREPDIPERVVAVEPPEENPYELEWDTAPPIPAAPPARTAAEPEIIQAYSPPRTIVKVEPVYPHAALQTRTGGVVVLDMIIDEQGIPVNITVLRPRPFGLTEAAVAAARQWRFEPCSANGRPVRVRFTLTVRFNPV